MRPNAEERFWKFVAKTDTCWLWQGAKSRKGYGMFCARPWGTPDNRTNSMMAAHRFAWILLRGAIPQGPGFHGTCVLHKCDTPSCVNPDHLFLGTNADNVHDMDAKGRRVCNPPVGSRHHAAKLTEGQIPQIVAAIRDGLTMQSVADEYGMKLNAISAIWRGITWRHVSGRPRALNTRSGVKTCV